MKILKDWQKQTSKSLLWELCDNNKRSNIHVIEVTEEIGWDTKKIFGEIMDKQTSNL